MNAKTFLKSFILPGIAFLLIFAILLSVVTLIYYPKWSTDSSGGQMAGFYKEPKNTIDVIFLGSCNMYTSISPVLMYEEYGVTGYAFTCPDQELSSSYYYLREALKHQKPKVVVLESLFFTHYNTEKRERYNRFALDYMPLNFNKISAAAELAARESEFMSDIDPTTPDPLLTFMGYLFPILRYHARTDLTEEDFTFFLSDNLYNEHKGNHAKYNFSFNDGLFGDVSKVFNGPGINEVTEEYFPRILELCEKNGIPLVIMKSPNYVRWGADDTQTAMVREYAGKMGVPFVDLLADEYDNYIAEDYNQDTTLNVYGDVKLTHTMGEYLVEEYGLAPTELSGEDKAVWDACVADYYAEAEAKGTPITQGEIAYIINLDNAASVRWNRFRDCDSYSVYRSTDGGNFEKLADVEGYIYDDTDVTHGSGYSYYVVANEGENAGYTSGTEFNVFVAAPENYTAVNEDGAARLNWDAVEGASKYRIHRLNSVNYSYSLWDSDVQETTYLNSSVINGRQYTYRLTAVMEVDGEEYVSESVYATVVPQDTPEITSAVASNGAITLRWKALENQTEIQIWRKREDVDSFTLYGLVEGDETKYVNANYLEEGMNYSYRIVAVTENYGVLTESSPSNIVTATAVY